MLISAVSQLLGDCRQNEKMHVEKLNSRAGEKKLYPFKPECNEGFGHAEVDDMQHILLPQL